MNIQDGQNPHKIQGNKHTEGRTRIKCGEMNIQDARL